MGMFPNPGLEHLPTPLVVADFSEPRDQLRFGERRIGIGNVTVLAKYIAVHVRESTVTIGQEKVKSRVTAQPDPVPKNDSVAHDPWKKNERHTRKHGRTKPGDADQACFHLHSLFEENPVP